MMRMMMMILLLKILGTVLLDEAGKDQSRANLTSEGLSNETDVQPLYSFMT